MRIITRTKPTPTPWLSVLPNIMHPASHIRRAVALVKEVRKIYDNTDLPIHEDVNNRQGPRLISRNALWLKAANYMWTCGKMINQFNQRANQWRSNISPRSRNFLVKLGLQLNMHSISPACDCGYVNKTIHYIVNVCRNRIL